MTWQSIRLELDRTRDFPNGSAGRAYLLRLPLRNDGSIDEAAILRAPEHATMRRLWASEADLSGHVRRIGNRWALVSAGGEKGESIISEFDPATIREGGLLRMTERCGLNLPFRVAKVRQASRR